MLHVTVTCPDEESARRIARAGLQDRLAACATLLPGAISLFHWQGRIDEETETLLLFKTTDARREALVALIGRLHPYELPVIQWQPVQTTAAATEWLLAETR